MKDLNHLLQHGEYQLDTYQVQLTELGYAGWLDNGPCFRAIVTNRRLILMPESGRLSCQPTVIPFSEIRRIWNVGLGRRDGVILTLRSGERLQMFVSWNQGRRLMKATMEMMALRPGITPHYAM